MRLWSLHPGYLDARGLVALWREGLLARKVLQHQTKGYKNHPQLDRFNAHLQPMVAMDCYLRYVYEEAVRRGYHFDVAKIGPKQQCPKITVTDRQLKYELNHLKTKIEIAGSSTIQENSCNQETAGSPALQGNNGRN